MHYTKMKLITFIIITMIGLVGCAGVDITPITSNDAKQAHETNSPNGYIVYEPVVLVEISKKEVCVKKDEAGKCTSQETVCSVGAPFVMPDYKKPYRVNPRSGFGKSGAEITIADGWRLGGVKDTSDNTAILDFVGKAIGIGTKSFIQMPAEKAVSCKDPGLYRVNIESDELKLTKMHIY